MNTFYHGDCKLVMEHDIEPESIDLIYLDPPFFTGKVQRGTAKWHPEAMEFTFEDSRRFWGDTEKIRAMRTKAPEWLTHIAEKRPDFASYLFYVMERLKLCKKVLRQTGSIYLHCDYRASHYLKMVMDEILGGGNFRNEIAWCYSGPTRASHYYPRKHDAIHFYTKSEQFTFNIQRVPYAAGLSVGGNNSWAGAPVNKQEYLDRGKACEDWWADLPALQRNEKERVGYPTQKPVKLLERIILASSNEGDVVLDPFCGCGTTILAAQKLNRRWIGIDINRTAYDTTIGRETQLPLGMAEGLATAHFVCRDLEAVKGLPHDEFELWVNEFYGASRADKDKGVDGITKDGTAIQTKAWMYKVSDETVRHFVMDARVHPNVQKPIEQVILVSQSGFTNSARAMKHQLESEFDIEIELKMPEDLLPKEE